MTNYPKDPASGAPKGYHAFGQGENIPSDVVQVAVKIKDQYIRMPFGTVIPFQSNGQYYMARIEPHSNKPRGVSVYKKNEGDLIPSKRRAAPASSDSDMLNVIYKYYDQARQALKGIVD